MYVTLNGLKSLGACNSGLERFTEQTKAKGDEQVDAASLVGGANTYGDFIWLASNKTSRERVTKFACDCVLLIVELIKPHTDDYGNFVNSLKNVSDRDFARTTAKAARKIANTNKLVGDVRCAVTAVWAAGSSVWLEDDDDSAWFAIKTADTVAKVDPEKVNQLLIDMLNEYE